MKRRQFLSKSSTLVGGMALANGLPMSRDKKMVAKPLIKPTGNGLDLHTQNFLDCLKSRQKPNADIAIAQNTALNASLGNIAFRTNSKIFWDAEKQQIIGNDKAQELTKANYQNG